MKNKKVKLTLTLMGNDKGPYTIAKWNIWVYDDEYRYPRPIDFKEKLDDICYDFMQTPPKRRKKS